MPVRSRRLLQAAFRQTRQGKPLVKPEYLARIVPTLFWLALAFTMVMALLPKPPALPVEVGDKVQHMLAFAALSLLAFLAFPRRRLIELFAAMAALGALIELLQMVPALHRDAQFMDWVADCGASLVVLLLCQGGRWLITR